MQNSPRIETERFILRKFNDEDVMDLHEIISDELINKFLPFFRPENIADTKCFLEETIYPEYQSKVSYFYAVEEKATHKVVGYIDLGGIDENEGCGELGYTIHRGYWGKGIATEVSLALIKQLQADGFRYIYATHDKNNGGSGKVLEKSGLKYCYSYEEQWIPKDFLVVFRLYQLNFDENKDRVYDKFWRKYPQHYIGVF